MNLVNARVGVYACESVSVCVVCVVCVCVCVSVCVCVRARMYIVCPGLFEVVSAMVADYQAGMRADYNVQKCSMFQRQGEIMLHSKTYYIAAVEMTWDYSPNRTWETEMFNGLTNRYHIGTTVHHATLGLGIEDDTFKGIELMT